MVDASSARSDLRSLIGMMDRFVGAPIRSRRDSVSEWTADTALAVLLKDLKAAHLKGLERDVAMPFNALSSTLLFGSMGKEKPQGT